MIAQGTRGGEVDGGRVYWKEKREKEDEAGAYVRCTLRYSVGGWVGRFYRSGRLGYANRLVMMGFEQIDGGKKAKAKGE